MKIIVITGQTATGKTKLALEYAEKYNGELINCDSRQIYKGLDIITGKDLPINAKFNLWKKLQNFDLGYYEFHNTQLWLYDIIDPNLPFSSYEYTLCANEVINDIVARGKTPIIIGGTYFYLKDLLYGVSKEPIEPDWELRKELEEKTVEELQNILKKKAPEVFEDMNESDNKNPRRLMRKIEIVSSKNQNKVHISSDESLKSQALVNKYELTIIALQHSSKKTLTQVITNRVENRIKDGAIQEVKTLLQQGYTKVDLGLQTIGYQQIIKFLTNELTEAEMKNEWIIKELQYAKRQITFMKQNENIEWQTVF